MLTLPRQRGAEAEGRGLAEREACSSPCGRKNRVSPTVWAPADTAGRRRVHSQSPVWPVAEAHVSWSVSN